MSIFDQFGPEEERSSDILREYAGLLTDVGELVDTIDQLPLKKEVQDSFTFPVLDSMIIPNEIKETLGSLDYLSLHFDIPESTTDSASLSIDIFSKDSVWSISRTTNPQTSRSPDAIIDFSGKTIEVEPIDKAALNTLIMSLVQPDDERGYKMFEEADLITIPVLESIRETLQYELVSHGQGLGYGFSSADANLSFFKKHNQPVSFSIQYAHPETGQNIIVRNNMETDFKLSFTTQETVPGMNNDLVDTLASFYPTVKDIQYLRNVLKDEANSLEIFKPKVSDIDLQDTLEDVENIDPAIRFDAQGNDVFSPQYTEATLGDLEFELPKDLKDLQ